MNLEALEALVLSLGLEKFRAKQIFKWIYGKYSRDFNEMTDLSPKAKTLLSESTSIGSLKLVTREISSDGTQKFLFATQAGDLIESVLMYFSDHDSYSACISSQVGCAVGCSFCATGTLGFKKNLTAEEILEQILFMENLSGERISNVVYMGQGEPLHNYDEVLKSIHLLRNLASIGVRHITISTSGIVPKIDMLAEEGLQITLALSLHDPVDTDRDVLVPINKKWKVQEVLDSLKKYVRKTNRRVTIEYVMLDQVNDSEDKAQILGDLVRDLHCNINLIPYNTTDANDAYRRSRDSAIEKFVYVLEKASRGKTITVRRERGHDISAACGQLANRTVSKGASPNEKQLNYSTNKPGSQFGATAP